MKQFYTKGEQKWRSSIKNKNVYHIIIKIPEHAKLGTQVVDEIDLANRTIFNHIDCDQKLGFNELFHF